MCMAEKPLTEFYMNRTKYFKDGRSYRCKICEKQVARNQPYNPEKQRISAVRHLYGLEPEDVENMLKQQNGVCAICFLPSKRKLHIDHCHNSENKKVRGLLCHLCNHGLGQFKDNIDNLKSAIKYLEKSQ